MRLILLLLALCTTIVHVWAEKEDSIKAHGLKEVVVSSSYITREADHILAIPTKEQQKHAVGGYDLLRNLMIPGMSVNSTAGIVNTPSGSATIYIDGREAGFREIQSLRPKDIASIEYYDLPTGKYANDAASINFILKKPINGGYTQIDAKQGVGFLNGDYNLISKYITGNKSINLWAGYAKNNPKSSVIEQETFNFEDYTLQRDNSYKKADNKASEEYVQASVSNRGTKYIWMFRGGVSWKDNKNGMENGSVSYWLTDAEQNKGGPMRINSRTKTIHPSIYFYGLHTISDTKSLDYVLDGYYAKNNYNRRYDASNDSYFSVVKENYYYSKINANYSITLNHRNRIAFMVYEFLRISDSDYSGQSVYTQNLISSETILFADYSQRLGSFFYDINPGVSFLTYRLKGMNSINHLSPRLQTRMAYMIDRTQQLQLAFALGNTFPKINTINNVEQRIDPIIILKGNPKMDNSILLSPRLSYNVSFNKVALETGASYFYQNHSIISDYYIREGNLISSFRDDCAYHRPSADISISYKPSNSLNMQISGDWSNHLTRSGAGRHNLSSFSGYAMLNYYIGDFSFGAMLSTPTKDLEDYQIRRKTFWKYQLSTMWNHGNWAVEANTNNLFIMNNKTVDCMTTALYSFKRENWNRQYNQYATLKIVYSFDYGKKTSKSPEYQHNDSESAILK